MEPKQTLLVSNNNEEHKPTGKIALDPEKAEEGLAQLVMTVIELLRQLVERQAMRRVEGGTLSDEEEEKLGVALMNLEEKMEELKEVFGLDDDDLNIDLGPLGNLL
ncbi:gas vesicle protein K [Salipaludibacillus neizhouensis]|uniref:Gas vesicle protein K n=1 Tax=Salipaludibacillus neizhouensis TaxID=885475 RepID=A0A3A9KNI7_9BACI|nr:gas vesicle protein K [Salipaludibacillus neizhouensis]RKL66296.1 gas vesicle protein K [Salipaludibacillus neizhouensis]